MTFKILIKKKKETSLIVLLIISWCLKTQMVKLARLKFSFKSSRKPQFYQISMKISTTGNSFRTTLPLEITSRWRLSKPYFSSSSLSKTIFWTLARSEKARISSSLTKISFKEEKFRCLNRPKLWTIFTLTRTPMGLKTNPHLCSLREIKSLPLRTWVRSPRLTLKPSTLVLSPSCAIKKLWWILPKRKQLSPSTSRTTWMPNNSLGISTTKRSRCRTQTATRV